MKLLIRYLILLYLIIACAWNTYAIKSTRLFDSREIISSNYSSFCIDKDSVLWIGTQYGLLRFDGNNFDKYLHKEYDPTSLSDSRILKILRDSSDRLWIGTCEGLNLYDPVTDDFRRVKLPNSELLGYISYIWQLSDGNIVFIVSGVGLHIIDFSSGDPVAVKYMWNIGNTTNINTLCETQKGELVAGTHSGEIIKISPNGQTKTYNLTDSYIQILTRLSDKTIFIATTSDCWIWDTDTDTFRPVSLPAGMSPHLLCATTYENGDLLIGTKSDGLLILEKSSFELRHDTELSNPVVNINHSCISTILHAPSGALWLGCPYQGIIMLPQKDIPFNFINLTRLIPDYYGGKTCVATSRKYGKIWVGLENGELLTLDPNGNILFINTLNRGGSISSLLISRSGKLYAGVDNHGLYQIDPETGATQQIVNINGYYQASAITEDNSGNIYLGVHGKGVIRVNPATKEAKWLVDINKNAVEKWISSLYCDRNDRLWIGQYGGLSVYNIKNDKHTSVGELYPAVINGVHNSITQDIFGRIWDATSTGIFIFDTDRKIKIHLSTVNGLSDIYVSTIVFDRDHDAWVGTHGGLNRIATIRDKFEITPFYSRNDMSDNDYYSSAISPDGQLIFSGEKGLTTLSPQELKLPKSDKEIFISGIFLNGKKVNLATLTSSGDKVIPDGKYNPDRIRLSYRDNSLVIRMSTKNFRNIDNLIFQWRIVGSSDEWTSTSPGNSVITLPHFRSGNFTLEIRAVENGQYSNLKTVKISVSPPWYLTTLAKIIYSLIICIIIVLVVKVIRHRNKERDNEARIKYFINISHEIRSPLTLILSPLERIMKKPHDPETAKNLNLMHRNATRILSLINQLLDIRKIDKGKMNIQPSYTEFISFTRELVEIFKPQALEKNLNLEFKVEDKSLDKITVWIDRYNFDKVLVNLISNALKYTPSGGHITVSVAQGVNSDLGEYAEVKVADTGIGLDEKTLDHLFERFYQGKFNRSDVPIGFGIGLDLCRMLVELHDGTITAANRTDCKGSIFTVRIPMIAAPATDTDDPVPDKPARNINQAATSIPVPKTRKTSKSRSAKILIVDDDIEIRAFLSDILSGMGKVIEATDGEEAMIKVMETMPDLIITDVVMPRMDGLTLLKTIKGNIDTNHIPVILLSSKNDVSDRMAGWDKGADGYLGKPFVTEEVLSVAHNLIDTRRQLKSKYTGTQNQDHKIDTPELKGNDKILIDKIVAEIDKHLDDQYLNVDKLSHEVGLSRAHLNRKMKDLFGLTPSEFIRNVRLRKACELLQRQDVDISQIAYSLGYASQPHFSSAFKRFTGMSPTEYRRNHLTPPA